MKRILTVTAEQPLYDGWSSMPEVLGTQYDIAEEGEERTIGTVNMLDYGDPGDSYVAVYDPTTDKLTSLEFAIDVETLRTDPADIAIFAATAAMLRTPEAEAELLVALGEDGFANI